MLIRFVFEKTKIHKLASNTLRGVLRRIRGGKDH